MSRSRGEESDDHAAAAEEVEDVAEDQPLRTLSHETTDDNIEDFTTTHGLADRLEVLQSASLLLRYHGNPERVPSLTNHESEALARESTQKWRQSKLLYFTIFICALGGIEQGWAQTGMNGANLYIPRAPGVQSNSARDASILGLINCGIYLGQAVFGSCLAEPFNSRIGRRGAIFVGGTLCFVGNLGSAISSSWPVLVFFRLVLGAGLGLNSSSVNMYAAECAPAYIRGGLAVSW